MALGLEQSLKIVVSAVDNASTTLNSIRSNVQGLGSAGSSTAQTLDGIGTTMQGLGRDMTRYVGVPIMAVMGAGAKAAMDFESQIALLAIATKDSGIELETWRDAAIAMGNDTSLVGVDASESAAMMTLLAKNGASANDMFGDMQGYLAGTSEMQGVLRAATDLSAASELSLVEATDAILISLNTYGLGAEDAMDVANTLVQTADASVASVGDLVGSLKTAGPVLANFGQSYAESLAQVAILSQRGIVGPEAGTNLRSMYNNMFRGSEKNLEAISALGVELWDAEGNFRPLVEVIDELNAGMLKLTDQELFVALKNTFGTYGQLAGITLGTEGAEGYTEMQEKIKGASTVSEVAKARTETFAFAMENFQGVLQTFMIQAGTPFIEDFLTPLLKGLTDLVQRLNEVNPETLDFGIRVALIGAAVGPALIALGTMARSLAAILTLYKLIAGAQTAAGLGGAAAGAGGAAGGAAGLGGAAAGLSALPAVGALGVAGVGAYAATHPAETERGLVGFQDWLRGLVGLDSLHPGVAAGTAGADKPFLPTYDGSAVDGSYQLVDPAAITAALGDGGALAAESWVGEYEASMAEYDSVLQGIGLGASDLVNQGILQGAQDIGGAFVAEFARSISPELVPYVMAFMAAKRATEGPVG